MDRETTAKVLGGFAQHIIHTDGCGSMRVLGRFGSRSGLRWQPGDAKRCTCGLAEWLHALAATCALATMQCSRQEPGERHEGVDAFEALEARILAAMKGGG